MCGIVGVVGQRAAVPVLLSGLRQLEYRGYDSAGIATLSQGCIERRRSQGKVDRLAQRLVEQPLPGVLGIAHTRWATHGLPIERNAHPIVTPLVAVVHNGIIENYREIRIDCERRGETFETDTDTESVAVLVTAHLKEGLEPLAAVDRMLRQITGTFALVMLFSGQEDFLICARRGSPLAIGFGDGEMYAGSDALALAPVTRRITYLEDGDCAVLGRDRVEIYDADRRRVVRNVRQSAAGHPVASKGDHAHFMLKEIFEQPEAIGRVLRSLIEPDQRRVQLPDLPFELANLERISIVACGTSYHAGLVARYWLESVANVQVDVDIGSEYRYRTPRLRPGTLVIGISQSGETADTLAALRYAKSQGAWTLGIVNQLESSIAREVDAVLPTLAGSEIGVASTKAFTTQLVVLAGLAIAIARAQGAVSTGEHDALMAALTDLPSQIDTILSTDQRLSEIARELSAASDVLYLGRGTAFPIALEGALKLKEVSYIHAEGYAAGELKHGPIALVDHEVPIVVLAPPGELFGKTASNMAEVMARGGRVILLSDRAGIDQAEGEFAAAIALPDCHPMVAPILYTVPMQLLAYHAALHRGTDVDQPRNLAKSVTVE